MGKRSLYAAAIVVLTILLALLVWQGSFTFGDFGPASVGQIYIFWGVSSLVFLLTITVGFLLFRAGVKLYIERQRDQEGSHIKTKLVAGSLMVSMLPVIFMVIWSVQILNRTIDKWFSRPAQNIRLNLIEVGESLIRDAEQRAKAQAHWFAGMDSIEEYAVSGKSDTSKFAKVCTDSGIIEAHIELKSGTKYAVCGASPAKPDYLQFIARAPIQTGGELVLETRMPVDIGAKQREIKNHIDEYDLLAESKRATWRYYLNLLVLITFFILYVATWIALFLARQISVPIGALLEAAREVRSGNLGHRVQVGAVDEMATLVRAFNDMTKDLEANSRELERRRRFTETILESIPTGVISVTSDGRIQRVNPALSRILPAVDVPAATVLDDLFSREDTAEIRYLMKRARRTGLAARQLELHQESGVRHLALTVSALEEKVTSGFVIVIEDTSELLRAQKTTAWNEVARRIAHEIKNPLTPIMLSAERIARQLERMPNAPPEFARIVRECTAIISVEADSVKNLVDEFSQFARFPSAQPAPEDLNEVVESALAVFAGRLEDIDVRMDLTPHLPVANLDREQFKRVVVNLVDNAAEAMQDSLVKVLYVATHAVNDITLELVIADSGPGISPQDKEKLFLPYFSTKGRGTGLGLAIVNHILNDHNAQIRVEDNQPQGARFIVEIPVQVAAEAKAIA